MNETELCKEAFKRGADFAAQYLGESIPLGFIEEAFEKWLAEVISE